MKKIMFSDKYGLTKAVLEGCKTMTRRVIPELLNVEDPDISEWGLNDGGKACITLYEGGRPTTDIFPTYQPGEIVAVAQSYKDLGYIKGWVEQHISPNPNANRNDPFEKKYPGWNNKMFVPAELNMAQRIRITDIKVERMQDISEEDCMKEGIYIDESASSCYQPFYTFKNSFIGNTPLGWNNARDAFADLIDKVSGKGTWEENPWVFVYSFELVEKGGKE